MISVQTNSSFCILVQVLNDDNSAISTEDLEKVSINFFKENQPFYQEVLDKEIVILDQMKKDFKWDLDVRGYNFVYQVTKNLIMEPGDYQAEIVFDFTNDTRVISILKIVAEDVLTEFS